MINQASKTDQYSALYEAELFIDQQRKKPQAPPFIGLIPIQRCRFKQQRIIHDVRSFLGGDSCRLEPLFHQFPNTSIWLVANTLSKEYGETNHAVYKHIEDAFEVTLNKPKNREILQASFCAACDQFGLPTRGFDRAVDIYLLHAGVSHAQIPHLVDAFMRQETTFESPPVNSTFRLDQWEDDALYFLPDAVRVLRRPIQWDETAWHASLFARIRAKTNSFIAQIPFERYFKEAIDQYLGSPSKSPTANGKEIIAQPRLFWQTGELVLRLPRCEGRIPIGYDETSKSLRLRGGEDWPLPQPWPHKICWQIAGQEGKLELFIHQGCIIFDKISGRFLREISLDYDSFELDVTDAVILARSPFLLDGEPAIEIEQSSYVGYTQLGLHPISLELGSSKISLRAKPKRRLMIMGDEIASGPRGKLYGLSTNLRVETGINKAETRVVRVSIDEYPYPCPYDVEVAICEHGIGEINLNKIFKVDFSDPVRVQIELMAPSANYGTGIKISEWIWSAFQNTDGVTFKSSQPAKNLVKEESVHIKLDNQGNICLDTQGGYLTARVVFKIEDEHIPFDIPWPDVVVIRRRKNGISTVLPSGSRLSIGEDDRFDTISIRCPDSQAELIVRGRQEKNPFAAGMTRNLSVRDLMTPASDQRVLLQRDSSLEILLFEIANCLEPQEFMNLPTHDGVRLRLRFDKRIDAVAVEVETEMGKKIIAEAALRYRLIKKSRPDWFHAEICVDNLDVIELTLNTNCDELGDGLNLARLLIRLDGQSDWRPLRNSHGDSFAVILENLKAVEDLSDEVIPQRFETLCRWLVDKYAPKCWGLLNGDLVPRWKCLGKKLKSLPYGRAVIMKNACLQPPDHVASDWIPVLHPLQFAPDLYAAPRQTFSSLSTSVDPGVAEMASLVLLDAARIRDSQHFHQTISLPFKNRASAEQSGVPLEGFDPILYFKNLAHPHIDDDPSAGWMWKGTPLLGPGHWRAAHLRIEERFESTGMFADDIEGGRRQNALNRTIYSAYKLEPNELRPPVPSRSPHREPDDVDRWTSALLSGFARASRNNEVEDYIQSILDEKRLKELECLDSIALLIRLAPELFAFYLLLWEIAKERS